MSQESRIIGKITVDSPVIYWKISDILSYLENDEVGITGRSRKFSVPGWRKFRFYFTIYTTEDDGSERGCSTLNLVCSKSPKCQTCAAYFSFGLMKSDGTVQKLAAETCGLLKDLPAPKSFLKKSELIERRFELVPMNDLTIVTHLKVKYITFSPSESEYKTFRNILNQAE